MKILEQYLEDIQNEQLDVIGKGLSTGYKYASKALHHAAGASSKVKMPDIAKYLYSKRDEAYKIAEVLKHNPSPENIYAVLVSLKYKAATIMVVAGILTFTYKRYKRNWTKAGRYCKGTSGSQRTACLRRFKVAILKKRIEDLQKAKEFCKKSRNPQKCVSKVDAKILKIKERVSILQTQAERKKDKNI